MPTMTPQAREQLHTLIREALATYSEEHLTQLIADAHNGHPDGHVITNENLHLLRQYRNTINPSPYALITEALARTPHPTEQ